MGQKRLLETRCTQTPATVHIFTAAQIQGFAYLNARVNLIGRLSDPLWIDERSEGRILVKRKAVTDDFLGSQEISLLVLQAGQLIEFAKIGNIQGALFETGPDGFSFWIELSDTPEARITADLIRSGQIVNCSVEYRTYFNHRDFVDPIRREADGRIILTFEVKKIVRFDRIIFNAKIPQLDALALREYCKNRRPVYMLKTYGVDHADRVADFGKRLFVPGADPDVIAAFAYIHDLERSDAPEDPGHGERSAAIIDEIRETYLAALSAPEIEILKTACVTHSTGAKTDNTTINICHDADRLDMPRLGIIPDPERMATEKGAYLARMILADRQDQTPRGQQANAGDPDATDPYRPTDRQTGHPEANRPTPEILTPRIHTGPQIDRRDTQRPTGQRRRS